MYYSTSTVAARCHLQPASLGHRMGHLMAALWGSTETILKSDRCFVITSRQEIYIYHCQDQKSLTLFLRWEYIENIVRQKYEKTNVNVGIG